MRDLISEIEQATAEWCQVAFFSVPAIVISVSGWVNTTGWTSPTIQPRDITKKNPDGYLNFDVFAEVPEGIVHQTKSRVLALNALYIPDWVSDLRLWSASGPIDLTIAGNRPLKRQVAGIRPWPFPWADDVAEI